MPVPPEVLSRVMAAIRAASDDGSPVAAQTDDHASHQARLAVRRWNSFERRAPKRHRSDDDRVEDLARGLIGNQDRSLIGPEIEDYRYVAGCIAAVLRDDADRERSAVDDE